MGNDLNIIMSRDEFLLHLDELFEEDAHTLTGDENLREMEMWDSLTALGFIALVDEQFDMILSGNDIENCETINDLVALVETKLGD